MNSPIENIIVNSSQYTPVYFIEDPGANQARPIVVTANQQKPISNTLKTFYENSGKLEDNLLQSTDSVSFTKPEGIIKKTDINVIGNNLKLANFLLPKAGLQIEASKQYIAPVNNVVLKPVYVASTNTSSIPTVTNTIPKLDVCSKIVKLKDLPSTHKHRNGKLVPKKKPKEDTVSNSKTTSVQLLKLGETYHSLNELSDDQMKIVNHALKIFSNPKNSPKEPTYDPVTNTRFIYKVVSPKDLTVVGKNKVVIKQKKQEVKKESVKRQEKKEAKLVPEVVSEPIPVETKVTRSGRKVKLPKNILPEEVHQKPKKKSGTIASCFQCSSEFSSLYRLQRHYEHHPTHIPARIHSNLFHCLLAIIKTGSEEDRANIFLQQLEQVITKIKSLIPCLLKGNGAGAEGKLSTISEDVGRLFGISPGKYNLDIDALSCVKDKDGHCLHNPAPPLSKPAQPWSNKSNEETTKVPETDDCARINSAEKWPTVSKRMERKKPEQNTAKKIKLIESEVPIELGDDDIAAFFSNNHKTDISSLDKTATEEINISNKETTETTKADTSNKPTHIRFHSTHFDIRSSPMKPTSTVFRKFQINPEKMPKFDIQEIQPLISQESEFTETISTESNESTNIQSDLFIDNPVQSETSCKDAPELNFNTSKEWTVKYTDTEHGTGSFMKSDSLINENTDYLKSNASIEPSLIHVKDIPKPVNNEINISELPISDHSLSNQGSVLNFLDSLGSTELSYPDTTIRNHSVDFQLDLFSFSN
ncbi:uncharacterized protein LOC119833407 [Zerene cesonia]|uniref:uncharacterized protein LOC119833407 n=1 Tax=Zerene cesonia TaxID=33412 RepID=UPI0018E58D09|nr:uncharacterized protein LOC119833407 [Zerene cesonia]